MPQPYAAQHSSLHGPSDQRPTAEQVIRDQNLVGELPGLNVLITGCTSGIGIETARALYLTGANIYITARDVGKGREVAAELSTDSCRPVKVRERILDGMSAPWPALAVAFPGIVICAAAMTKEAIVHLSAKK